MNHLHLSAILILSASLLSAVDIPTGWPSASNTGVPAGTTLRAGASRTITADGTVINGERIASGGLKITARNVIIRNSWITSSFGTGEAVNGTAVVSLEPGSSATIERCILDGSNRTHAGIWHSGASLVARGNDIRGVNDGIFAWDADNFTVEDNYLHDFTTQAANGHIDGFQTEGGSHGVIRHNTIVFPDATSCIAIWNGRRTSDDILIEANFLGGSGFPIYVEDYHPSEGAPIGGNAVTNVRVIGNVFTTQIHPLVGTWGVWYPRGQPSDGWNRSGNRIYETGQNLDNSQPAGSYEGPSDRTAPGAPTGLRLTAVSATRNDLVWTAASDNVGVTVYRVERLTSAGYRTIGIPTGTSFSDTSAPAGASYRIAAVDKAGNVSAFASVGGAGGNRAPVASAQSVSTNEDSAKAITLAASDADGDALTYAIVAAPAHGSLSGNGASRTYTPAANYSGSDSFTFKANDGMVDSNTATVSITIAAVNDRPMATAQPVSVTQGVAKAITLAGTDVEGSALSYAITANPAHGNLSGSGAGRTYTPAAGYSGADSFIFTVSDGTLTSNPATVTITVAATGWPDATNTGYKRASGYPGSLSAPVTTLQSGQTYRFMNFASGLSIPTTVRDITFYGCRFASNAVDFANVDLRGSNIAFDYCTFEPSAVSAPPVARTKGYQFAIWQYQGLGFTVDHCDFWGWANAIQFNDSSQAAPVIIRNSWFHDARDAGGLDHTDAILENWGGQGYITIDHNTIVSKGNTNGLALQSTTPGYHHVTVTDNYFSGFGYTVNIGGQATGNQYITFTGNVFGTDIKPDWGPLYGWGEGNGTNVWRNNRWHVVPGSYYTPASDDGKFWTPNGVSTTDWGSGQTNRAPVAGAQSLSTVPNTALAITLSATDADGDSLAYAIVANPAHGSLTGSGANRTYTPVTGYSGGDSFTFKVNDGQVDSNVATIAITIAAAGASENLWGGQTAPSVTNDGGAYELGTVFTPTVAGQARGIRVYAAQGESGAHSARIWNNATNVVVGGPYTLTFSGPGWYTYTLPSALALNANASYTVAVSTGADANRAYAAAANALTSGGTNGAHLSYPANAGVFTSTLGSRPTSTYQACNYLRDIVFVPASANRAPVVSAASATPTPVTGRTASLGATASDDAGEATLSYAWSATGPAAVAFSPNGSHAAKASTATFTRSGSYVLTVTARDAGGLTGTRTVQVAVDATATALSLSPTSASVQPGRSVDFNASLLDQFGQALASQPTLTWSVTGRGGTIDAVGTFSAGDQPASASGGTQAVTYVVTATDGGRTGTALVTVSDASTGAATGAGGCGSGGAAGLVICLSALFGLRQRRARNGG